MKEGSPPLATVKCKNIGRRKSAHSCRSGRLHNIDNKQENAYIIRMVRKNISSGSPMEGPIGFSRAVRIGSIIAVSGTAAIASDGSTVYLGDVYGQTKYCLEIIKKVIEEAGGDITNTIRTRVMLVACDKCEDAAKAHGEFFGNIKPACTFIEVNRFINEEWLVEIEADCVVS
jgi:enamine deaminase RidA (YjgF/YER057c/UK114 family)